MSEYDEYNFQPLKRAILALSVSQDWEAAKKEWKLASMYEVDEPDTCLCGHSPIIEVCVLTNALNGQVAEVGNRCKKRFLGLRYDLIFTGVNRVKDDVTKGLNPDTTLFFLSEKYSPGPITISKRIRGVSAICHLSRWNGAKI